MWGECVVKPVIGSLGFGSFKIDNYDMLYNVSKTLLSLGHPVYLQRFIKKPQRDIRVFVVGDEVVGSMYRVVNDSRLWKTNIAQGGKPQPGPVDEELLELSIKATKALGLLYSGVDIAEGDDGYYVLEVNAAPLWKGLQNVIKTNIASKIVDFVISLVRR